jgi:hypothetical protein
MIERWNRARGSNGAEFIRAKVRMGRGSKFHRAVAFAAGDLQSQEVAEDRGASEEVNRARTAICLR